MLSMLYSLWHGGWVKYLVYILEDFLAFLSWFIPCYSIISMFVLWSGSLCIMIAVILQLGEHEWGVWHMWLLAHFSTIGDNWVTYFCSSGLLLLLDKHLNNCIKTWKHWVQNSVWSKHGHYHIGIWSSCCISCISGIKVWTHAFDAW